MNNKLQTTATPQTIDSREVAQMVGKQHKNLMADIRNYIKNMESANELNFQPVDFFIPSTYLDSKGEERSCYAITKMGCEFIANKLTGAKGTQFTAAYVTKFNQMEQSQAHLPASPKPLTLASVNNTAKILGKAMDEAGMEPVQKVLAFQQLYRKAGIDLNLTFPADERLYFLEDMAKELGVVSNNGIPHKQAMGAIVRKLSLDAGEKHLVHFERNGHPDSTDKYSRSVLDKAKAWLEENQYPAVIPGETKNFNVRYEHKG